MQRNMNRCSEAYFHEKTISVLLLLAMLVSLFAGLALTAEAAQPTSAAAVNYRTSSGYVYNWGKRDTVATFLTTYAQEYYTGSYSYATLSALSGSSASGTGFYSSALGTAIHNMLEAKQKSTTSYDGTKNLYKYTDCEENADKISSYYSGTAIGPNWGSSPTWNREHTWPNSKGQDGSNLSFTYTGITPQCIGDNVEATLYATKNGRTQSVTKSEYSVRQYCVNQLNGSIFLKLRRLLSNLLAYGAAAQTYANYKTDALVTSGSDIKSPAYSTFPGLSGLSAEFTGTAAADILWAGVSLTLTDGVAINFRFYAENTNGLSVQITMGDRTETFTEFNAVDGMDNVYEVSFEGIKATEFGGTVTAKFFKNSSQIGDTLSYSVNTYVCAKQNDTDAALAELVQRLYNYGTSAASYAN